jgi:hypothetical protein
MELFLALILNVGAVVVPLLWYSYCAYALFKDLGLSPVVLEYGAVVVPLLWYA